MRLRENFKKCFKKKGVVNGIKCCFKNPVRQEQKNVHWIWQQRSLWMSYKIISVLWWSEARLVCIEEYAIVFTASLGIWVRELCAVKKLTVVEGKEWSSWSGNEYTRKRCLQCKNSPFSTPCKEIMTMETRIPFHSYIFYILRKMFNSSCFFFFFSPSSLLVSLFTVSIASPTRSLSLAPLLSSSHEFFNCLIEL